MRALIDPSLRRRTHVHRADRSRGAPTLALFPWLPWLPWLPCYSRHPRYPWHRWLAWSIGAVLAVVLAVPPTAHATTQPPSTDPAVDSATVARAAWARASAALRAGDVITARREATRAATAWPTQPAYVWGRAVMSARAADTAGALSALTDFAAMGLGRDLRADPALAPLLSLPGFAAVVARHDTNRHEIAGRSSIRAILPDTTLWPEGADYDPRTNRYYIASVRHRTLAELSPDGTVRELWPRDTPGLGAILGVRVDTARGVLWVTTSGIPQMHGYAAADSGIAALLRVRISDGHIERRWDVAPAPGGHVLGDLAIAPNGDIYFSDSQQPVLHRLRSGPDTLEHITSPLFRSLQGMAPTPDGRTVYIADYSHGLLRLDVRRGTVARVTDAPATTALGCDGIAWYEGSIIAVQNGVAPARIMRFVLDSAGTRIVRGDVLDRHVTIADEPTIGFIAGRHFVYVATSQWEKHDDRGARVAGAALAPAVLLAVPIPR